MPLVSPTQSNPNDEITVAAINNPINQLAAVINGGIDSTNLASQGVNSNSIAARAVKAGQIDFGGSGAGVWWEEIGRVTLSSPATVISLANLPARKYLQVYVRTIATGGTAGVQIRFNNDSGTNYSRRFSVDMAAPTTGTGEAIATYSSIVGNQALATIDIVNEAALEKTSIGNSVHNDTLGATSAPGSRSTIGKWTNTTSQITRIDVIQAAGTGSYAVGSELIVLGHN